MVVMPLSTQRVFDRILAEGREEGRVEGRVEGREIGVQSAISALDMIRSGSSLEEVSKATGLSKAQISQLSDSI